MDKVLPDEIVLFAAGLGTRMGNLTSELPKSLLQVFGKPILYHALDLCKTYRFKRIFINTHYLPGKIEVALEQYLRINPDFPKIVITYEPELLDTGGTIKNLCNLYALGSKLVFTMNTDVILHTKSNVFTDMIDYVRPDKMDFLLLLQNFDKAIGYKGFGDFNLTAEGKVTRLKSAMTYDYMYTGLGLIKPEIVATDERTVFSLQDYYFRSDRVFGLRAGQLKWYHATHPEDLVSMENTLS